MKIIGSNHITPEIVCDLYKEINKLERTFQPIFVGNTYTYKRHVIYKKYYNRDIPNIITSEKFINISKQNLPKIYFELLKLKNETENQSSISKVM